MTDMLRQAENLSWDQFSAIYEATVLEHNLLPSMPIEDFANGIGERASNNEDDAKVMRVGAESLQRYIGESDPNAPTDLLGAAIFAEKHASSFS